jgi:hypothetical protein
MPAAQHAFPEFETQLAAKDINLTSDTLNVGLIASTSPAFTWGATPEGYTFVSSFLGGDGTHGALTEVSGGGYSRQALTSVTFTSSGENVTLSSANPSWTSATFSTTYAFLYDATVGAGDSSHPIIAYYDFGGTQAVASATFTLTVSGTGWVQWQYQ